MHKKRPYCHFFQVDLTRWKQGDVLESTAKCARCVVRDDSDAAGVEFKCLMCQKKQRVSEFNPVTIRSWKEGKKGEKSDWKCFDCLHPACGKCEITSVYVSVHNAWVKEQEYYKHAKSDESRADLKGQLRHTQHPILSVGNLHGSVQSANIQHAVAVKRKDSSQRRIDSVQRVVRHVRSGRSSSRTCRQS